MNSFAEKSFKTPEFSGIWLPFNGDRLAFRTWVENYLRETLKDPLGQLVVGDDGPRWKNGTTLELSYSHTEGMAVLVYSTTHSLGVDIESEVRKFNGDPLKLAARFFPPVEVKVLEQLPKTEQHLEFLKLWVQKEAYAKLTRLGLAKTLEAGIIPAMLMKSRPLPVCPSGFLSCVFLTGPFPCTWLSENAFDFK